MELLLWIGLCIIALALISYAVRKQRNIYIAKARIAQLEREEDRLWDELSHEVTAFYTEVDEWISACKAARRWPE